MSSRALQSLHAGHIPHDVSVPLHVGIVVVVDEVVVGEVVVVC